MQIRLAQPRSVDVGVLVLQLHLVAGKSDYTLEIRNVRHGSIYLAVLADGRGAIVTRNGRPVRLAIEAQASGWMKDHDVGPPRVTDLYDMRLTSTRSPHLTVFSSTPRNGIRRQDEARDRYQEGPERTKPDEHDQQHARLGVACAAAP